MSLETDRLTSFALRVHVLAATKVITENEEFEFLALAKINLFEAEQQLFVMLEDRGSSLDRRGPR